jgi:hypothetical protein
VSDWPELPVPDGEPRLTYLCPKCRQRIMRVYTAAQLGYHWPAAYHRGFALDNTRQFGTPYDVYVADLNQLRDKGFMWTPLGLDQYLATNRQLRQDNFGVSCKKCGAKYSVPVRPILDDLLDPPSGPGAMPTRETPR